MSAPPEPEKTPRLHLRLMGTFLLTQADGTVVGISSRKNRALLAILALSPGQRATRERLAGLLWGDHGENLARSNLRQALAILRKELGPDATSTLAVRDDHVLFRTEAMTVDAVTILGSAGSTELASLRSVAALCAGEFLADVSLNEEAFEDWLSAQRAPLAAAEMRLLEKLVLLETGTARIDVAQRLVALEPLRESSHRQLISAYAAEGERGLALKQFEACRKLLREELGVEPADETQDLRRQISAGETQFGAGSDAGPARPAQERQVRLPSVAVLPFANLGDDPSQSYFSDGVAGDIISELSRWQLLSVQSRSASFRYRGAAVDLRQVAWDLNVRYVVEGSVRRQADRIRISVQLIDATTGNLVWAERFDRNSEDLFDVQDQVVRTIVSTLAGRVQVASVGQLSRRPPASLLAYECVLKGNALPWSDPAAHAEATKLFARAIELDPGYGLAHSLLADMYAGSWQDSLSKDESLLEEAFKLAQRAVDLDSNDSTCFSILGQIVLRRRMYDLALQYARRGTEINPNNQWNTADLGIVLCFTGQAEAALECFKRAQEIDPFFGPSWLWPCLGITLLVLRRPKEALTAFEHMQTPSYWVAALMAGCHARLGNGELAVALVAECLKLRPDFSISRRLDKEPFKNATDAAYFAESMKMAGLPE